MSKQDNKNVLFNYFFKLPKVRHIISYHIRYVCFDIRVNLPIINFKGKNNRYLGMAYAFIDIIILKWVIAM